MRPKTSARSVYEVLTLAAFAAALALPAVYTFAGPRPDPALLRELPTAPPAVKLQPKSLAALPEQYRRFFNATFGLRHELTRLHGHFKYALASSPNEKVLVGKGGWLFYNSEDSVVNYRRACPFSAGELNALRTRLQERSDWLAARGIRYLVVVCPAKHTVYPELMPDRLNRLPGPSRLEQFTAHMRRHSTVEIVDVGSALAARSKDLPVYGPRDTHWTGVGARIAYEKVAEKLKTWYPAYRHEVDAWDPTVSAKDTDLAGMAGLKASSWNHGRSPDPGSRARQA